MQKYAALRVISGLLRAVGWLTIIIGAFLFFYAFIPGGQPYGNPYDPTGIGVTLIKIAAAFSVFISGLIILAFGELIQVGVDIALNTHQIAANTGGAPAVPSLAPSSDPLIAEQQALKEKRRQTQTQFVDAEKEMSEESLRVLRRAKEEGYRISLANEGMVAAESPRDSKPIYFVSNWDIYNWGRIQKWV